MTMHHFDIADAEKYGVDRAIILNNLRFWLTHKKANETHINEYKHPKDSNHPLNGKKFYWTYNSHKAFAKLFPYWTENKIKKDLLWLEKQGVIIKSKFNKANYDQTNWYSIPHEYSLCQKEPSDSADLHHPIVPNGTNRSCQTEQPIPYINTNINTDTKRSCATEIAPVENEPDPIDLAFKQTWEQWPNKVARKPALKAFTALCKKNPKIDPGFISKSLIENFTSRSDLNEKIHFASYINAERWNDQPITAAKPKARRDLLAEELEKLARGNHGRT